MRAHPIIFSGPMAAAILAGRKTQTRRVVRGQGLQDTLAFLACENDTPGDAGDLQVQFMTDHPRGAGYYAYCGTYPEEGTEALGAPFGQPGARLWVREPFRYAGFTDDGEVVIRYTDGARRSFDPNEDELDPDRFISLWIEWGDEMDAAGYVVDEDSEVYVWPHDDQPEPPYVGRARSPIHMPRWASRLTLEVVSVRVERLQDISAEDAIAEGLSRREGPFGPFYDCGPLPVGGYGESNDPREAFMYVWDSINGTRPGRAWADNPWVWVVEFGQVEA